MFHLPYISSLKNTHDEILNHKACGLGIVCMPNDFCLQKSRSYIADAGRKVGFPATPFEKLQAASNKEVASFLKYVYQDPKALYEVDATIFWNIMKTKEFY